MIGYSHTLDQSRFLIRALLTVLLFASSTAHSQLMQNLMIGNARALGLANAVTADPPGVDSIHFNPAGLANIDTKGRYVEVNLITVPSLEINARANTPYADQQTGNMSDDPVADKDFEGNFQIYIPGPGRIESKGPTIFPRGGAAYHIEGSKFTFATSAYATVMIGNKREEDDPGTFAGRDVGIGRIVLFSPTVAYEINEKWTIGGGIIFSSMGAGLGIDMRFPFLDVADLTVDGEPINLNGLLDAFCIDGNPVCSKGDQDIPLYSKLFSADLEVNKYISTTYNLGLLWKPTPWFTWGLAYQGGADDTLKGDYTITYDPGFAEFMRNNPLIRGEADPLPENNSESGTVEVGLPIPAHIATGISLQLTPKFKVNMDYKFTQYSDWDAWPIQFKEPNQLTRLLMVAASDSPPNSLPYDRGYNDGTNVAIGMEYRWSDQLLLRGGIEDRPSVIPPDQADLSIPIADAVLYAFGAEYKWDKDTTVDFALAHLKSDRYIPAESSRANDSYEFFAQYPALDMEFSFETIQFMMSWKKNL